MICLSATHSLRFSTDPCARRRRFALENYIHLEAVDFRGAAIVSWNRRIYIRGQHVRLLSNAARSMENIRRAARKSVRGMHFYRRVIARIRETMFSAERNLTFQRTRPVIRRHAIRSVGSTRRLTALSARTPLYSKNHALAARTFIYNFKVRRFFCLFIEDLHPTSSAFVMARARLK